MKRTFTFVIGCCTILFCAASLYSQNVPETASGFDVFCGNGFTIMHHKGTEPLSIPVTDSCDGLYNLAYSYERNDMFQECYDTARKYIERCANTPGSYNGFSLTDAGIQNSNLDDTARYRKYRYWLISVLFLNTKDPHYFCYCMSDIAKSYQFSEHLRFPNAQSSIDRWMNDHHFCQDIPWHKWDSLGIASNHAQWLDGDTSKPFDSSYNTMHQLGLDILDSLKFGVHPSKTPSSTYLSSFSVNPNPSHGLITANYTLSRQSFVQFTVFDALGRVVLSRAGESEIEGLHELPIDLRSSPSGTYYVRIEAGFGEVKTVKLVHDK